MSARLRSQRYGAAVLEHFDRPRNVGSFAEGTPDVATGAARSPDGGDEVRIQLRFDGDRVAEARYQAFGCGWTIAAASCATELLVGRSARAARSLDRAEIDHLLAIPGDKQHCSELASRAAVDAAARRTGHPRETQEPERSAPRSDRR